MLVCMVTYGLALICLGVYGTVPHGTNWFDSVPINRNELR